MNIVLAIEPDASQVDPLTTLVRALGAELQVVDSARAAIVALDQRVPDVVLLGRTLPQEQRTEAVTHLRSATAKAGQVRTIDVPELTGTSAEAFSRKIGVALAAADYLRVHAMSSMMDRSSDPEWNAVPIDEQSAPAEPEVPDSNTRSEDLRAADIGLIEAEVEFRLKSELERLQADVAQQQARELARVEAEAADRRAREVARVEAEAAQQRAVELAKIEQEAASQRESAIADADARVAVEASARDALAAELERVRREAEEQLAAEVRRVRDEAEQVLATQLEIAKAHAERDREERIARARAEAEAGKAAAIEEARRVVEAAAARAKVAEDEVVRVRLEADAQLKAAVAKARAENDARLQEQVARAQAETEARLEAQLATVIGQATQSEHTHREMAADADRIRLEAAEAARAAAEAALATETTRIRAEANQHLESEIARLRAEAASALAEARFEAVPEIPLFASSASDDEESLLAQASRSALKGIRWDYVATAALIMLVAVAGVLYLPRAVTTAARTSSALVGTAGRAARNVAKEAAAAAPVVTRRALTAAERAMPHSERDAAKSDPGEPDADPPAETAPADDGPGFIAAFARFPMDVYVDGKRVGTTEDGQLLVKSGAHRFEFVSKRFKYRSSTTLTIRPGHVVPYTVTLPSAEVRITTTPGAEVFVEGERVGVAPLDAIQVPIGTRDIMVKDATGQNRQGVEVKYGETTEIALAPQAEALTPGTPHLAPLMRRR